MTQQVHLLNGDALKERFPKDINGDIIVMRECLIEGDVSGETYKDFIAKRAKHIGKTYEFSEEEYFEKVASEFEKLRQLPENVDINLWFEDDLFCQTNLWFLIHLLSETHRDNLFLVRPKSHSPYSFAHLSNTELFEILDSRIQLKDIDDLSKLWKHYSSSNHKELLRLGEQLRPTYAFIAEVIQAHLDRLETKDHIGRPKQTINDIILELNTTDFGTVFREFQERAPIYGFGDLQVKRLYDEVVKKK